MHVRTSEAAPKGRAGALFGLARHFRRVYFVGVRAERITPRIVLAAVTAVLWVAGEGVEHMYLPHHHVQRVPDSVECVGKGKFPAVPEIRNDGPALLRNFRCQSREYPGTPLNSRRC